MARMEAGASDRARQLAEQQRASVEAWRQGGAEPRAGGLDASMKRNMGFIKKCRAGQWQDSAGQLVREIGALKLEKYASEIVPAVLEGLLRCRSSTDYAAAMEVLAALHARFPGHVTERLASDLARALVPPGVLALAAMAAEQRERAEQQRLARQRVQLRVLGEMHVAGLLWGIGGSKCAVAAVLQRLLGGDTENHLSMALATAYARAFRADLGLDGEPGHAVDLGDEPAVSCATSRQIRKVLNEYADSGEARLEAMSRGLARMRQRNEERLFSRGSLHAEARERMERHLQTFGKLRDGTAQLCAALGREAPRADAGGGTEADRAAEDFCHVSSAGSRRALAAALVDAPRRQMFVIPLYARFMAALHPFFPDIAGAVVADLQRDFRWLARRRVRALVDTRLRNVRYIAELTKFGVAPLHVAVACARALIEQMHAQDIEVLGALLGACGRFLTANLRTAPRIQALLDVLLRKRRALALDDRSLLLIENACRACQPRRAAEARPPKLRTPYERYIRRLVLQDLAPHSVAIVCLRLRRLPWPAHTGDGDDPQRVRRALVSCFSKIWKIKHENVPAVAAALAVLGRIHPWFCVAVIDAVLERVRLGLERALPLHSQRRLAEVGYVAELCNHRILDAPKILALARQIMLFGHSHHRLPRPACACPAEAPRDYFRIRLVCALLAPCASILRTTAQADLPALSLLIQLYMLAKPQPLPVDIDYNIDALFADLFAAEPRYYTWADAAAQVPELEAEEYLAEEDRLENALAAKAAGDSPSVVQPPEPELDPEAARRQAEALEALREKEEEDALEREISRLMLESSDPRRERSGGGSLDVGIPMNLLDRDSGSRDGGGNGGGVRFALLTGRKQRPAVREVAIPVESHIAQRLRQQEEVAMREKAQLKRIVLNYERRDAEEERRQQQRSGPAPAVPGASFVARRRNARAQAPSGFPTIPDHFL
ncbi:mRNA decay protein [Coemansia sp. RSA 552]|nr:mRNA decay protein [Coemansia sp. RSA 552]